MNFFKDRINELYNITWPTRKQAIHSMIVVLSVVLITGLILGVLDYAFNIAVLKLIS